jgi:phytoene/squalene synthetase
VGSLLISKNKRKYFHSLYSFARLSDDIADENVNLSKEQRTKLLTYFSIYIEGFTEVEKINNPIFVALKDTLLQNRIPKEPFFRLLNAFMMDVNFQRPAKWEDLLNYCHYSANPVGEAILRIYDEWNENTIEKAQAITTSLQLINFWQDLSIDIENNRNYIPLEFQNDDKSILKILDKTKNLLNFGSDLYKYIKNWRLRYEIKVIIESAKEILKKEYKLGNSLFQKRPKLSKYDFLLIFTRSANGIFNL